MWTANLFQVTTGQIGPQLQLEAATWSVSLNDIESISVQLRKSDLPRVDLQRWFSPWWAGIVLMYDGVPIVAGPLVARPAESFRFIYLEARGIRQVLTRRLVIREMSDWSKLASDVVQYKGLSLGTIAKRVVQLSTSPKAGGSLPISYPIPDQTVVDDADHQRTYKGYNLANLYTHDVLTKLSEVSRGPDIMFRPRLVREDQLTFDMLYGDEHDPRITQKITPLWDTSASNGAVVDMDIVHTGTYQTDRVFATGAGIDAGTLVRMSENQRQRQEGYPLLETVTTISDSENPTVVLNHSKGALAANLKALTEIQMTVRAEAEFYLGSFWSGDLAYVYFDDSWVAFKEGTQKMRILNVNGNLSNNVRMSLQTED